MKKEKISKVRFKIFLLNEILQEKNPMRSINQPVFNQDTCVSQKESIYINNDPLLINLFLASYNFYCNCVAASRSNKLDCLQVNRQQ